MGRRVVFISSARIFMVAVVFLSVSGGVRGQTEQWPEMKIERVWSRPLGEGYSGIATDANRLYTLYREGYDEIIVALDSEDGRTVWEHRCEAKPDPDQFKAYGQGPNAPPVVNDGRVLTIGFTGLMHCLEAETGQVVWSKNVVEEYYGIIQYYGYSNRPLVYWDTVIVLVGSDDFGVIALSLKDGSPVWKSDPFDTSYAPPVLIDVDGQDQVVFFAPDKVVGIDAKTGMYIWSHPVANG